MCVRTFGPFPDYAFYNRKLEIAKGAYYPDGHDKTNWQDLVGRLGNVGVLPVVVRVCFDGICGGKRCGA
jgi:hypothetical protein